jgi:hypothetical protein
MVGVTDRATAGGRQRDQRSVDARRRPVVGRRALGALLLSLAVGVAGGGWWLARPPAPLALYALSDYVADPPEGRRVVLLDPLTLGDRGIAPGYARTGLYRDRLFNAYDATEWRGRVDESHSTWLHVEYDGLERVVPAERMTIIVSDGPLGRERSRFHPPAPVGHLLLSGAGRRLVLFPATPDGDVRWGEWWLLETAGGRVLSGVRTVGGHQPPWQAWLDREGRWLYRLEWVPDAAGGHLVVTEHDAFSGVERGRLAVPAPGAVAVAPGGRRLAVVHQAEAAITVVDLAPVSAARTITLVRSAPAASRQAPEESARRWGIAGATFTPDGRQIYLYGALPETGDRPAGWTDSFGVARVTLEEGQIVAEWAAMAPIRWLAPAPDGRSLYLLEQRPGTVGQARPAMVLRRLDPATLVPLAEREFDGLWQICLWPAGGAP